MDTIKLMEIYLSKLLIRRSLVRVQQGEPKRKTRFLSCLSFVFVSARTQHRLTACGQHHFEQSENIVFNKRTQNEVAFGKQCCASHKRCGFANDVALRANGLDPLPLLYYNTSKAVRLCPVAQKESLSAFWLLL